MSIFNGMEPKLIWQYFEEICKIPRPSKKEEKIIGYLLDFARRNKLEAFSDITGNVLIKKPATKGKERAKKVILQCHTDMVCEKNNDVVHDFLKDPIKAFVDGEWIKARGTTLGADDGIGIAACLAILADKSLQHGEIECLFTADEETGLGGAKNLNVPVTGKILINLDSEDEGELFIGCAGGTDTIGRIKYKTQKTPAHSMGLKITVNGLKGGHSGDDIDKGLGNSNKILVRLLWRAARDYKMRIHSIDGGNLRNAIAREAFAHVTMPKRFYAKFIEFFKIWGQNIKREYAITDPELKVTIEKADLPRSVLDIRTNSKLLDVLNGCPHGVISMSRELPGLVETSTNLASVKMQPKNIIEVVTSQRSSLNSAMWATAYSVESVFKLAGFTVTHSEGYPGWTPNKNSEIVKRTINSYKTLFKTDPVVRAIHAGLECGLFLNKYPDLDMVSFGPTIRGAHSPSERLEIASVKKFWDLLIDVLEKMD